MATSEFLAVVLLEEYCRSARFKPKAQLLTSLTGPNAGRGLGGHSFSINSNPVIHVGSGTDLGDLKAALEEHARTIADEVRRIIQIDFEREAVV